MNANIFWKYMIAQCKRILKLFPIVLFMTVLLCSLIGASALFLLYNSENQENRQKVSVGIVGNAEDSFLGIGIEALEYLDDSRDILSLVEMSEAEARRKMETGELKIYFIIPDDFIASVVNGENSPITYVTTNGEASLGTAIMEELADSVSGLVQVSQTGVFAMQDYMMDYNVENYWGHTDTLNLQYIDRILGRNVLFDIKEWGISDSLSTYGYYFCGILIILLLLWGISAGSLFARKNDALAQLFVAKGYPVAHLVLAEFIAYTLLMALTLSCILVPALLFSSGSETPVREWEQFDLADRFHFLLLLLPVLIMISAMQFFIYEFTSNLLSGILAQFIAAFGLAYISGCLYPIQFFPEGIQTVSAFLPVGIARIYTSDQLLETFDAGPLMGLTVYSILFLAAAIGIRCKRIYRRRPEE